MHLFSRSMDGGTPLPKSTICVASGAIIVLSDVLSVASAGRYCVRVSIAAYDSHDIAVEHL